MTIQYDNKKVTANKDTLNYLSYLASHAAEHLKSEGYNALAKDANDFANTIYQLLNEANFYTEV